MVLPYLPVAADPFRDPPDNGMSGSLSFFFLLPVPSPTEDCYLLNRLLVGGKTPPPLTVGGFLPPILLLTPLSLDLRELAKAETGSLFLRLYTLGVLPESILDSMLANL